MELQEEEIGKGDPVFIATEIWSHGLTSCAAADEAGWLVTKHTETRQEVDNLLTSWSLAPSEG